MVGVVVGIVVVVMVLFWSWCGGIRGSGRSFVSDRGFDNCRSLGEFGVLVGVEVGRGSRYKL